MRTVAIIGAGASGLTAIKCCLDEGLEPTCFEKTNNLGGLWYYTDDVREGQACVMQSTVINTSKEMMCFSDFPIPKEYPIFMHHSLVLKYFNLYADRFGLKNHIQYETEVLSLTPTDSTLNSTAWTVKTRNMRTGATEEKVFDAVMVCTGHHVDKKMPEFPGQKEFKGKIMHSRDYKNWKGFEGKKAVVVGIGNSGVDTAVDLSRVTSKTYLSTRRGAWVFSRMGVNGLPIDMAFGRRFGDIMKHIFPLSFLESQLEKDINRRLDHEKYSLKPDHSPLQQHPTVNDELPSRIVSGMVTVKPNIKRLTANGVEFEDGTSDEVDGIVCATGYVFGFPFIDKSILDVHDNKVQLYKYTFLPDVDYPTMSIIGCIQQIGALMPIAELQSRLATRVFKGLVTLPNKQARWEDVKNNEMFNQKNFVTSTRHTMEVYSIDFMDQLSELIGCKPNLPSLFLGDPVLAGHCFFGPCTPYQYRLQGPGKWAGAKEAILTQWERTLFPLRTRHVNVKESNDSPKLKLFVLVVLIAICLKYFFM